MVRMTEVTHIPFQIESNNDGCRESRLELLATVKPCDDD